MNLVNALNNELENEKFIFEDELDRLINNPAESVETKLEKASELLGKIALAEIKANLWKNYTTPPQSDEGVNEEQPETNVEG